MVYDIGDTSRSFSDEVEEDEVVHGFPNLVRKLISKWDLNGQSQNYLGMLAHCFVGQYWEYSWKAPYNSSIAANRNRFS